MRPVLCLITDRRRFGARWEAALLERVEAAARDGVDLIQVRERDLEGRALTHLVARCVQAVRGTRARVVVNDRLDVALAAGAHGVHLRSDSVPAARVRTLAPPPFLVGRSVHGVDETVRATEQGGLDYLICGTVFETASKPDQVPNGVAHLGSVAAATHLPVLGVGGITAARVAEVVQTGAAGIAAIGLFSDGPPDGLHAVMRQVSQAFDTPGGVP